MNDFPNRVGLRVFEELDRAVTTTTLECTQEMATKEKSAKSSASKSCAEKATTKVTSSASCQDLTVPPSQHDRMPDPAELLLNAQDAPKITDKLNIFPMEWRVETPRLLDIYESSRDPGSSPGQLP